MWTPQRATARIMKASVKELEIEKAFMRLRTHTHTHTLGWQCTVETAVT